MENPLLEILDELFKTLNIDLEGKNLLEVGPGDGMAAEALTSLGAKVSLVGPNLISRLRLEYGSHIKKDAYESKLETVIPQLKGQFDLVVVFKEFVGGDIEAFYESLSIALKPEGKLILTHDHPAKSEKLYRDLLNNIFGELKVVLSENEPHINMVDKDLLPNTKFIYMASEPLIREIDYNKPHWKDFKPEEIKEEPKETPTPQTTIIGKLLKIFNNLGNKR
jgi:hypothetical protein